MAKHRHEKVAKMGQTPGDVYRGCKIAMMEGALPGEEGRSKSFRKDQRKRAKVKVKLRLDREMMINLGQER